jgi:hypothetical protein
MERRRFALAARNATSQTKRKAQKQNKRKKEKEF